MYYCSVTSAAGNVELMCDVSPNPTNAFLIAAKAMEIYESAEATLNYFFRTPSLEKCEFTTTNMS